MKKIAIIFFLLSSLTILGQKKKNTQETIAPAVVAAIGIDAKVAGMKKYSGYFDYYYDDKQDKVFLVIDKLDTEFLYIESLTAGVGSNDIGLDRNQLGRDRVVKFDRRGPKVLLLEPNYSYRAISDNVAERKAVEEAFAQSVLWGFTVVTEEAGKLLVDATDFQTAFFLGWWRDRGLRFVHS